MGRSLSCDGGGGGRLLPDDRRWNRRRNLTSGMFEMSHAVRQIVNQLFESIQTPA